MESVAGALTQFADILERVVYVLAAAVAAWTFVRNIRAEARGKSLLEIAELASIKLDSANQVRKATEGKSLPEKTERYMEYAREAADARGFAIHPMERDWLKLAGQASHKARGLAGMLGAVRALPTPAVLVAPTAEVAGELVALPPASGPEGQPPTSGPSLTVSRLVAPAEEPEE